jgi:hypothetical protein
MEKKKSDYTSSSEGIFRDRTKDYNVDKGTITKTVKNKKGDLVKKVTRSLGSDKVERKMMNRKDYDQGYPNNDVFDSSSSFAQKGGSVINSSALRRQASVNGLRRSKKHK